jgi:hypothetical protein
LVTLKLVDEDEKLAAVWFLETPGSRGRLATRVGVLRR